jgi:hypothetical protein
VSEERSERAAAHAARLEGFLRRLTPAEAKLFQEWRVQANTHPDLPAAAALRAAAAVLNLTPENCRQRWHRIRAKAKAGPPN